MAKVTTRKETGKLVIDFTYRGVRCREQTALSDTPANRRQVEAVLSRIRAALSRGDFDYSKFFPDSPRAERFAQVPVSPTSGPIVKLQDVGRFELEGLEEVTAICDAQQRIVLLDLRLSKGGMPASHVQSTATQLDRKYKAVRRNLPFVGDGSAEWRAPNAVIEIQAPHMSFSFALRYWAPGGRELYRKWEEAERRQREQKKAGSL